MGFLLPSKVFFSNPLAASTERKPEKRKKGWWRCWSTMRKLDRLGNNDCQTSLLQLVVSCLLPLNSFLSLLLQVYLHSPSRELNEGSSCDFYGTRLNYHTRLVARDLTAIIWCCRKKGIASPSIRQLFLLQTFVFFFPFVSITGFVGWESIMMSMKALNFKDWISFCSRCLVGEASSEIQKGKAKVVSGECLKDMKL